MESPVNPQESSRILTVPKKSLPTISETSYKNFEMSSHLSFPTSRNLPLSLVGKTAIEKTIPAHSGHWIFRISKTFSIIKDNRWTRVHVSALEIPLFWNENWGKASPFTLATSFLKEKDEIGRQKVSITFLLYSWDLFPDFEMKHAWYRERSLSYELIFPVQIWFNGMMFHAKLQNEWKNCGISRPESRGMG